MVSGQVRKRQEMGTQMGTQARSTLGMSNVTVQGDTDEMKAAAADAT
jgi:hypothetical protein